MLTTSRYSRYSASSISASYFSRSSVLTVCSPPSEPPGSPPCSPAAHRALPDQVLPVRFVPTAACGVGRAYVDEPPPVLRARPVGLQGGVVLAGAVPLVHVEAVLRVLGV